MNIIKRTCATCAAFDPSATEDEEPCANLVFFTIHHVDAGGKPVTIHQAPSPTDRCDSHQTHEEDAVETREIDTARAAVGIEALGRIFEAIRRGDGFKEVAP